MQGLGIAYAPEIFFEEALSEKRLLRLLSGHEDQSSSTWIVYPERRHLPLRVRRAMDHLIRDLGD